MTTMLLSLQEKPKEVRKEKTEEKQTATGKS
jgi:hypothetical protein